MNLKKIKLEIFYLRKYFFKYPQGFWYLYNRFYLAKKILQRRSLLSRPVNSENLSVHLLTCHNDLVNTIWSLAGYYRFSRVIGQLYLHNDGTLTKADKQTLLKFFPDSTIIDPDEALKISLDKLADYPEIGRFRSQYGKDVFIKKLIDSFTVSDKRFHLLFDTDILWFSRPEIIEQEMAAPIPRSLMFDALNNNNYVYFKDGSKLSEELSYFNAGIIFYARENFNLGKLDEYLQKFDTDNQRNFYFIEQAGHAYSLDNLHFLPKEQYVFKSPVSQSTVAKHYTKPRRPMLYIEGVKILNKEL